MGLYWSHYYKWLIINTSTVTAFTNKRLFGLILLSSILDLSLKILYRETGVRGDVQLVAKHVAVKTR